MRLQRLDRPVQILDDISEPAGNCKNHSLTHDARSDPLRVGHWPNGWLGAPGTRWLASHQRGCQHQWESRGHRSAAAPWRLDSVVTESTTRAATEGQEGHEERPTPPGSGETQQFGHYTPDTPEAL